jgi:hypothetical protein
VGGNELSFKHYEITYKTYLMECPLHCSL